MPGMIRPKTELGLVGQAWVITVVQIPDAHIDYELQAGHGPAYNTFGEVFGVADRGPAFIDVALERDPRSDLTTGTALRAVRSSQTK